MQEFPDFFETAPIITLYDPLSEFLGAADGGILEYRYADAVRLAGHSCPTLACAFLMTRTALAVLYADQLPVRGEIAVDFRAAPTDGTTGVTASVVRLITGAAGSDGFKGIGGRFRRDDLLRFEADIGHEILFTRNDTGAAVQVSANPARVPAHPRLRELMSRGLTGSASHAEQAEFRDLWRARVRELLLKHADDPMVIDVQRLDTGHPHISQVHAAAARA